MTILSNLYPVLFLLMLLPHGQKGNLKAQTKGIKDETIRIGFLVQNEASVSALKGAELAVTEANRQGALHGKFFSLKVRSMEGPWGTGSKQAVDLIFEENVWALMGYHDGRNAHLVEQAATKSTVPLISAWSSDPSLSQAFVPWFFNCVPTDRQQAQSLVNSIYSKNKINRVAVISGKDYDSKMATDYFINILKDTGKPSPVIIGAEDTEHGDLPADWTSLSHPGCLVLFCKPQQAVSIIRKLRSRNINIKIYGSIMSADENLLGQDEIKLLDNNLMIASGKWPDEKKNEFIKKYIKEYGRYPGLSASYSYDAARVLIEAIRQAGKKDRLSIEEAIKNISLEGVTGLIGFDNKGNRAGSFEIMKIKNGMPSIPE